MQQVKNRIYFLVFISVLFLIGCKESETTSEKNETDTTAAGSDTSSVPGYDPAMEPLTVGAAFSKKLHDSLNIKMYEFTLKPGDSAALHTHPDHAVYVLQGGKLEVTFKGASPQIFNLRTGDVIITGPLSDVSKNTGNTTVKLLILDIYRPRDGDMSYMPAYDPALDPLTVGGASCKKLGDTLNIKMFECTSRAGQSAPLHAHPDHAIYVLQGGKLTFTPQGGARQEVNLKAGTGWIGGPVIDSAKNIGNTTIKVLEVDIYRPRGK